jgi:hypothetical protein
MTYWLLRRPFLFIALIIVLALLPAGFFQYTLLTENPEKYLTHPAADEMVGYFSRDPTGSVIELAYAGFEREQIRRGILPLWSPHQSLGHPFIADTLNSALLAPLNILRYALPPTYWDVIFIVNLILGCWFIFLLARSYRLDRRSALIASVSMLAIGNIQTHLQVSSIALVTTWIPLVLYGIELQIAAVRPRFAWACLVAGLFGVITGGHATITLFAIGFVAFYTLLRLIQAGPVWPPLSRIAGAGLVAFLLAGAQWLPFVGYVAFRGNTFVDYYSLLRVTLRAAPAFVLPYVYGPLNSSLTETVPAVNLGEYWSVGWLAPALMVFFVAGIQATRRRKEALALILASVPIVFWAFGIPPISFLSKLPFFNRLRGYYGLVTISFVAPLLVGFGYQALVTQAKRIRPALIWTAVVFAVAVAVAAVTLGSGGVPVRAALNYVGSRSAFAMVWGFGVAVLTSYIAGHRNPHQRDRLFWVILAAIVLSALGYFSWGAREAIFTARRSAALCFVAVLVAATLPRLRYMLAPVTAVGIIVTGMVIRAAPNHLYHRHNIFEAPSYMQFLMRNQRPEFRSYGMEGYLFPNFSAAHNISSVNILTAMVTRQVDRFFRAYLDVYQGPEQFMGVRSSVSQPLGNWPIDQVAAHKRFWDYIGVRYYVSSDEGLFSVNPLPTGSVPEQLTAPLRAHINCPSSPVNSVCFYLGTYKHRNEGAVTVKAVDQTANNVSEARIDSATVRDLACTKFTFPKNICESGRNLTLEISHQHTAADSTIAVFRTPAGEPASQALVPRVSGWRVAFQDSETRGRVWENPDARPRAYLAPESAAAPDWQSAQELFAASEDLHRTAFIEVPSARCRSNPDFPAGNEAAQLIGFHMEANRVIARVNAFTAGTFVLVDTFMPGWIARVDGAPQAVLPVNGTFRGACINSPGIHEIEFDYDPREWKAGVLLSLTGCAFVAAFAALTLRRRAPKPQMVVAKRVG